MFRATVDLDHRTDVTRVLDDLTQRATASGLPADVVDQLRSVAHDSIAPLVRNGSELVRIGSQMNVIRKVAGPGYAVEFRFNTSAPSVITRLIKAIRGR